MNSSETLDAMFGTFGELGIFRSLGLWLSPAEMIVFSAIISCRIPQFPTIPFTINKLIGRTGLSDFSVRHAIKGLVNNCFLRISSHEDGEFLVRLDVPQEVLQEARAKLELLNEEKADPSLERVKVLTFATRRSSLNSNEQVTTLLRYLYGYVKIPKHICNQVSSIGAVTYGLLQSSFTWQTRKDPEEKIWLRGVPVRSLAAYVRLDKKQIDRGLISLREAGLIESEAVPRQTTKFRFLFPEKPLWLDEVSDDDDIPLDESNAFAENNSSTVSVSQ